MQNQAAETNHDDNNIRSHILSSEVDGKEARPRNKNSRLQSWQTISVVVDQNYAGIRGLFPLRRLST